MSLHQRDMLEISELASAAADGRLAERDAARLEELLKNSAEVREYYVRFMGISAELAWAGQAPAAAKTSTQSPGPYTMSRPALDRRCCRRRDRAHRAGRRPGTSPSTRKDRQRLGFPG